LRLRLDEALPNDRLRLLHAYVRERVSKVLGLSSAEAIEPRQPLREMGLDSLMAVELRNLVASGLGIERKLSATLLFDYPSIAELVDYLAKDVFSLTPPPISGSQVAQASSPDPDAVARIEQLSDEEVDRLFDGSRDKGNVR
jgi:acyl carrier protein